MTLNLPVVGEGGASTFELCFCLYLFLCPRQLYWGIGAYNVQDVAALLSTVLVP